MSNPRPSASRYRAIVFDLDGTAVPNTKDGMPSPRLIKAALAAKTAHQPLHLVAATGRPLHYGLPVVQALGLTDPCIFSSGTVIANPATGNVIKRTLVPIEAIRQVLQAFAKHAHYELSLHTEGQFHDGHTRLSPEVLNNTDIVYIADVPFTDGPMVSQMLEAIPGIGVGAAPNWPGTGYVFNITHQDATKEHAVTEVLQRLGVDPTQAIGVGDGDNDLHLFAAVGHKVAMGNAGDALKTAADEVAPSIDEDGLAQIIEKYTKV
jgi:HAD superfamily hydrolase (TIGR01484 family)